MQIILIPGFWLDASSRDDVVPTLEAAGHHTYPVTLPGLESRDADRRGMTLRDHVDAVVTLVDSLPSETPLALVGHSGGGAVAHAVVDARPERIARVVYVDSGPLGDGQPSNAELPVVDGEIPIPLPDWSVFEPEDLIDLDEDLRTRFRGRATPIPQAVAFEPQRLDERRFEVPVTVICCEFSSEQIREWMSGDEPFTRELARLRDVEFADLPTGHRPQLTRPTLEEARARHWVRSERATRQLPTMLMVWRTDPGLHQVTATSEGTRCCD